MSLVRDAEREREEREQKDKTRKRKRRDSDGSSAGIMVNQCLRCVEGSGILPNLPRSPSLVFPTPPLIRLDLPREDAVREYSAWHQSQVGTEEQKDHYDVARELTEGMLRSQHAYDEQEEDAPFLPRTRNTGWGCMVFCEWCQDFLEDRVRRTRSA